MQAKTLSYLLCRFFAIALLIQLVSYSSIFIPQLILHQSSGGVWFLGFIPIVSLIVILFFWNKAEWVAKQITGKFDNQEIRTVLSLGEIQNAGFVFIGMFVLAESIPLIMKLGTIAVIDLPKAYNYSPWPQYIELGVKFIIGLSLIFGPKWFGEKINKVRNWLTEAPQQVQGDKL